MADPGDLAVSPGWLDDGRRQAFFFWAMAAVTALPLFGLGFGVMLDGVAPEEVLRSLGGVIAVAGYGHVAATICFYPDRGYFAVMKTDKVRFFLWPLLLAGFSALLFSIGGRWSAAILLGYFAWQMHHIQRQNYGIIAFAATSGRYGILPAPLVWILDLTALAGFCALLELLAVGPSGLFLHAGRVLYLLSGCWLIKLIISNPKLRGNARITGFSVLSWAFFLPAMIAVNPISTYWSYVIAHGGQYFIFVAVSSYGANRRTFWMALSLFGVTFWILSLLADTSLGSKFFLGVGMGHFLIDAKLWRLREPLQRDLVRLRFAFLARPVVSMRTAGE